LLAEVLGQLGFQLQKILLIDRDVELVQMHRIGGNGILYDVFILRTAAGKFSGDTDCAVCPFDDSSARSETDDF
jgi:hypothetical protein